MTNKELSIVLTLARCGLAHEPPSAAFVHQLRRLEKALSPLDAEKFKTLLAWHDTGREKSTVEVVLSEAAQLAAPVQSNSRQTAVKQPAQGPVMFDDHTHTWQPTHIVGFGKGQICSQCGALRDTFRNPIAALPDKPAPGERQPESARTPFCDANCTGADHHPYCTMYRG